ncbi:MAG: PilZ domain-containing protein [Chloroflexota bacterium]
MSTEKRQSKRFTVLDLDLYMQGTEKKVGRVINLSEGGMLAHTDEALEEKAILNFRIPFNREINSSVNFDFDGMVAWSRENSLDSSVHSVGIQFTQNPEIQAHFVQQMIKVYGS